MTMRILILGAGPSIEEDDTPVWLAEHGGVLLIERFIQACSQLRGKLIFAVRDAELRRFHIGEVIRLAAPDAEIVPIVGNTAGAACTALLCIEHIAADDELLILAGNEFLDINFAEAIESFRGRNYDAGVVVFRSLHPRYSYVRLDQNGLIEEAAEKRPISRNAAAGFTWFRRGSDFLQSAADMIRKDAHLDGRFFISLALNQLVLANRRMGVFEVDAANYHPIKSRQQLRAYELDAAEAKS